MRTRAPVALLLGVVVAALAAGCGGGESRKARYVEQGQQYMAEHNYTKARLEFRNALQIDPKDAQVRTLVGLSSEKLGEYDDAVKAYRIALAADETLVVARAHLARILALAGVPDQALELVTAGLERAPRSGELLSVRAVIHSQKGEQDAARKDAEQAYALEPSSTDVITTLAAVKWQAGEREETVALLRKSLESKPDDVELRLLQARLHLALERPADAERELVEVVRLDPRNLAYRNLLAQVYLAEGKPDRAIETVREAVKASPESVPTKIALVQLLAQHRSFEEAEKQLEAFRKEAPKDQELQLAIGDFYAANGRPEQAESIYQGVIDAAGTPARRSSARNRLAAMALAKGNVDEASRLAAQTLEENASDADALVMRAEIALKRGDAAAAVADLRTAFGNQPDSVPLAVGLARAYVQSGQNELAEQTLRSVVQASPRSVEARFALAQFLVETGHAQQARPVLEQLVAEQPNNLLALEGLARLQIVGKDATGALSTAKTIRTLQPRSAAGYLLEGQALQAQQRSDAAREAYEQAATADPRAVEPVVALTRLDVSEGHPERALARLDERLAKDAGSAILQALRGDVLMGLNRPADAIGSYAAAIKATPAWAQPYRGQAEAFIASRQPEKAVDALKAGVEATRGSRLLTSDLAILYSKLGRIDDAVAAYEAALQRDPSDDVVANNLAMLLVTQRSDARSLERAGQLARRFADSGNPLFLDTFGWVAYKRGQYPEAVAALEKAVAKAPAAPELRYHLGMAQLKAGKRDEARANLQAAVVAGADYPGIDEARAAVAAL